MTFTDSQKLACDISRNIAVTAGAGSGKTSVLVERYLWCLQNNDYQVRRIVAITFTEKAAGEMLGRIRKSVIQRIQSGIGDPNRWEDVLEKLPLANISTIHGFCQRLLREFPIEAGVDPNFEVVDEALKHILLIHLIDTFIRERDESKDPYLRTLAQLWTSFTLRNILLGLVAFRDKSLPWAERLRQENFPNYLNHLYALVDHLQQQGIQQIASDRQWQKTLDRIRSLIPVGDKSKLSARCLNILDYDHEFRQQTTREHQLLTLKMLRKECRMVAASTAWKEEERNVRLKEAFNQLKLLYDRLLPPYHIQDALEQSGFLVQQALAELFLAIYTVYCQEKAARRILDFDDLQEGVLELLEHPEVSALLSHRYDYIMVDEFQDTNQVQWDIIRKLGRTANGLAQKKFCIVGDEKQSIYMFRGADVAVFSDVRKDLRQANSKHELLSIPPKIHGHWDIPELEDGQHSGELNLAENFRSSHPLIVFFNYLFSRIFLSSFDAERSYDVPHQDLLPGKDTDSRSFKTLRESHDVSPVEFLLTLPQEDTDAETSLLEEPELVALRIREMIARPSSDTEHEEELGPSWKDIAILLRTRTRLKDFEDALRRHDIPFVVAGGIGFFQRQEIYDLANLLRFLVDSRQDIALTGVLRSPLFSFSDDQLLYISSQRTTEQASDPSEIISWTLWEKLQHHVGIAARIPEDLTPSKMLRTYTTLNAWKARADSIPIPHLLQQILDDTGLYGILAGDQQYGQAITNIEKFLDLARTFESEGFHSLSDFVLYLDQLIEIEEREGEAQIHTEAMNAVRLMTIHAAKGLEFEVVIVPEIDRRFNYGTGESIYIDTVPFAQHPSDSYVAVGVKGLDPEQNYAPDTTILREYLKRLNEEKTDAEMKRLLYVACTRAKEHLILSGMLSATLPKNSWLSWLSEIFPLKDTAAQQSFTLSTESEHSEVLTELVVPIHTSRKYQETLSSKDAAFQKDAGFNAADLQRSGVSSTADSDVLLLLQKNLHPVKGNENEVFRVSPSTLHLLFQCPRKYYYQQFLQFDDALLEQLFPTSETQQTPLEESEAPRSFGQTRGTIIHRMFEERIFDHNNTEQERSAEIARILEKLNISARDRKLRHLDLAIDQAGRSYESSGLRQLLAKVPEVYRERAFHLKVGRADISGIIDVLFLDPTDGMWTILDYKTNEIAVQQIEDEIRKHGYTIQMQLYALAVSRLLQVEHVRCILFFTFPGYRYEEIDLSQKTLKNFERTMLASLDKLAEGILDGPEDDQECEACSYGLFEICQPA